MTEGTAVAQRWVQFCMCFLCAAVTTLCSHQLIDLIGALGGDHDAYNGYAHISLGPLTLIAFIVAVVLLSRFLVLMLARRQGDDPVALTSKLTLAISPAAMLAVTFCMALTLLFAIESYEQIAALGHVEGLADTLGGNIAIGLAVLIGVSFALVSLLYASASAFVRALCRTCTLMQGLFLQRSSISSLAMLHRMKATFCLLVRHEEPLLANSLGLRAPPLPV